ncbi:MAG: hypothetical protein M3365_02620 [Gemmatimonadota bacterium]|nr:hypothetical protein [Gemmatimonadota bacterium]
MHFGYSQQAWDEMVDAGREFLESVARRGRLTTYTALCQVIRQRTGTEIDTGEYALNWLLGDISSAALEATQGALLTSLVTYLDDNRPGEGFFVLARSQGLLPSGSLSRQDKEDFWMAQVASVHRGFGRRAAP